LGGLIEGIFVGIGKPAIGVGIANIKAFILDI
jgi:hypothetical protein